NQKHKPLVDEFNRLTDHACADEGGHVDVEKVKLWQGAHGLTADGKIGAKTVEAAHAAAQAEKEKEKEAEQSQAQEKDKGTAQGEAPTSPAGEAGAEGSAQGEGEKEAGSTPVDQAGADQAKPGLMIIDPVATEREGAPNFKPTGKIIPPGTRVEIAEE